MRHWLIALTAVLAISLALTNTSFAQGSGNSRRDAVHFGNNIVVPEDQPMHDLVCFFCSVQADGDVHDVVVFFGNVRFGGTGHDVVVFGGNAGLRANAVIHDAVIMGGRFNAEPGATVNGDRVVFPVIVLFIPLIGLALIIYLIVLLLRHLFSRSPRRVVYVAPRT